MSFFKINNYKTKDSEINHCLDRRYVQLEGNPELPKFVKNNPLKVDFYLIKYD